MRLSAPDSLYPKIVDELAGRRNRGVNIGAIVAVICLELVRLATHSDAARVVDLLHRQFDGRGNRIARGNECPRLGCDGSDFDDIFFGAGTLHRRAAQQGKRCYAHSDALHVGDPPSWARYTLT